MWRVTIHPGVSSGRDAIEYDGEELIVCEEGSIVLRAGELEYVLEAGDTLHFKASIPHSWRNDGDVAARFTVTGTLPRKFRAVMHERVAGAAGAPARAPRRPRALSRRRAE